VRVDAGANDVEVVVGEQAVHVIGGEHDRLRANGIRSNRGGLENSVEDPD
jgi:hypothetical protein